MTNKEKIMSAKFSCFREPVSNIVPSKELGILDIFNAIKGRSMQEITTKLRAAENGSDEYSNLKRTLFPYATFSGTFTKRNTQGLKQHSGLICIDLDHLGLNLTWVKAKIESDLDHVVMSFVSPGGDGLKIIYPIDLAIAPQREWVDMYENHIRSITSLNTVTVDEKCTDVARACFLCHDPSPFLNPRLENTLEPDITPIEFGGNPQTSGESYKPYAVTSGKITVLPPVLGDLDFNKLNSEDNFLRLCQMTTKKDGEYGSPRNPWVQKLASRCNLLGMDQSFCEESVIKFFTGLPASHDPKDPLNINRHFLSPIRSTYRNYEKAHGTWTSLETNNFETPELPVAVYNNLPALLQDGCRLFPDAHEKDLFFLGLLTVLSACMPNIKGRYHGWMIEANLFLFIIAPAASGKGNLKWALKAISKIREEFKAEYEEEKLHYDILIAAKSEGGPKPKKPTRKSLLIPGNISSPAIVQALAENSERGLIFETEADTIANTMQSDWGDYSTILRNAFHHETISFRRRHENEFYEIVYPCLSVALSGTPDQVQSLLGSTEDGFFSRILFYDFKSVVEWKSPFNAYSNDPVFRDYMDFQLPSSTKELFDKCRRLQNLEFRLTPYQEAKFDAAFEQWLIESEYMMGANSVPTIKRLGFILFRIAMIMTAIRNLETLNSGEPLACKDEDFGSALLIVDSLRLHAFKLIAGMKGGKRGFKGFSNGNQKAYYVYLPNAFTRKEADNRAKAIKLNPKTAEKYLEDYRNSGLLEHVKHGEYKKTNLGLKIAA